MSLSERVEELQKLPKYADFTPGELERVAQRELDEISFDVESLFSTPKEKKFARELYQKYTEDFKVENISDKSLLNQLIYLEVFQRLNLQKQASKFGANNDMVPVQIVDALHKNLNQIQSLKKDLGLISDTKGDQNPLGALALLKKKFKIWRESVDQASRTLVCPHCGQLTLLKIRMEAWEAQKHPFFRDRVLGNEHLIKCYLEGKLKQSDVAKILDVSDDYIPWLISKWKMDRKQEIDVQIADAKS